MNAKQKATAILWIKGGVERCQNMREGSPEHYAGFVVGLLQTVHLINGLILGADEDSINPEPGHPPETVAEHLGVLRREMAIYPPMQAIAALSETLGELAAGCPQNTRMAAE